MECFKNNEQSHLKVMLQATIRKDDFHGNTAL